MNGQIINTASLSEMLTWKTPKNPDPDFFPIDYGLGIFKIETPFGIAYMHSGDAIGYYANMLYFPGDSTTIVYAVNSNYGKVDQFVLTKEAMQEIISMVK
jgi:D-alanyl-D-alanine carboxypeptidase